MARYDKGVKFDYPTTNDGFVSHVARRGAEKTGTGIVWFFILLAGSAVYLLIKNLGNAFVHHLGIGILVVVVSPILLLVIAVARDARRDERKMTETPWIVRYTCTDGQVVLGAVRYASKDEALVAAARHQTISIAGNAKPLSGYEVRWNGSSKARSATADVENSGFKTRFAPHAAPGTASPVQPTHRVRPSEKRARTPAGHTNPAATPNSVVDQLKELVELRDTEAITATAFELAKTRLLGG